MLSLRSRLTYGVMVALQILVLSVEVRILVGQLKRVCNIILSQTL